MIRELQIQDMMTNNLQDGNERAKQNSKAAENNYKRTLEKLNKTVEHFHQNFKPILGQLQDAEADYLELFKMNMLKFANLKLNTGDFIVKAGSELAEEVKHIRIEEEI